MNQLEMSRDERDAIKDAKAQEKLAAAAVQEEKHAQQLVADQECRLCLKPGERRQCCEVYYCQACWNGFHHCPSCQQPAGTDVAQKSFVANRLKVNCIELNAGVSVALAVSAAISVAFYAVIVHYLTVPKTMHGETCSGFLPTCRRDCLEANQDDLDAPLGAMPDWKRCTLDTRYKILQPMCVFDTSLYARSGNKLGYDMCPHDEYYYPGTVVMEDTVNVGVNEYTGLQHEIAFNSDYAWRSAAKSATWQKVSNGRKAAYCGYVKDNELSRSLFANGGATRQETGKEEQGELDYTEDFDSTASKGAYETDSTNWGPETALPPYAEDQDVHDGALVFAGGWHGGVREAVTESYDLRHGGKIEFLFKVRR